MLFLSQNASTASKSISARQVMIYSPASGQPRPAREATFIMDALSFNLPIIRAVKCLRPRKLTFSTSTRSFVGGRPAMLHNEKGLQDIELFKSVLFSSSC